MKNVITFGTFDLFHYGHLKILQRAASLGDRLIVGVSSDSLNFAKKSRYPIYSEKERLDIIASLKCVSNVFLEESLELKKDYILKYKADILVMGDDWKGKFDCFNNICKVVYFERTPSISTTEIIERIRV
ncbi:adenylyltransferase/cytidyltransferase family protein [Campylobacter sp. W0014]|uniref:adenylyltransferase/cytidyltransferase family protein n=1 Tax=Campylobacter TaxID=194 RepID=UPI001ECD9A2B|nr:adenylyltransferase/cytidyltransferase family protein [Campylobacter sp. W0014]